MSWRKGLSVVGCVMTGALAAAAEPLAYQITPQNLVRVLVDADFDVTYTPPLGTPTTSTGFGISELAARPTGSAVADVGLPDNFDGGTQMGIYIEAFDAHVDTFETGFLFTDLFAPVIPLLPPLPLPIPLGAAAATVDIADLDVSMVTPLSSNLISIPDPNDYTWGGVAGLRISGNLNLSVNIPGQAPIALGPPVPFDQVVNPAALAGSFTGDATSTTLVVGLQDATVNPDTAPLIAEPLDLDLTPLGTIRVTANRLRLVLSGNFTSVNRQYGLPQQSVPFPPGAGCGIGPELAVLMPALGWLSRRRRRGPLSASDSHGLVPRSEP